MKKMLLIGALSFGTLFTGLAQASEQGLYAGLSFNKESATLSSSGYSISETSNTTPLNLAFGCRDRSGLGYEGNYVFQNSFSHTRLKIWNGVSPAQNIELKAGLGLSVLGSSMFSSDSIVGANLMGGMDIKLTKNLYSTVELNADFLSKNGLSLNIYHWGFGLKTHF